MGRSFQTEQAVCAKAGWCELADCLGNYRQFGTTGAKVGVGRGNRQGVAGRGHAQRMNWGAVLKRMNWGAVLKE